MVEIQKNSLEKVVVSKSNYKGYELFDIRIYYQDKSGEWRPTKKGVTLKIELIDNFIDALNQIKQDSEK